MNNLNKILRIFIFLLFTNQFILLSSQTLKANFGYKIKGNLVEFFDSCVGKPDYYVIETEEPYTLTFWYWGNIGHVYYNGNDSAKLIIYRMDTVNNIPVMRSDSITKYFHIGCDSGINTSLSLQYNSATPFTAIINNYSIGNITYNQWDFGDGDLEYGLEPIHFYNNPGKYTIVYLAFDSITACQDTTHLNISIDSFGGIKRSAFKIQVIDKTNTTAVPNLLKISKSEDLYIYPNPAGKLISIANNSNEQESLNVFDAKGAFIVKIDIEPYENKIISILDWKKGLYLLVNYSGTRIKLLVE